MPGYSKNKVESIWLDEWKYEKINCVRCEEFAYLHDPSGGEYGLDYLCRKCARIVHYKEIGMFE